MLDEEKVMNLPMQTQPVLRAIASYSTVHGAGHSGSANGVFASGNGIVPSEIGVEPSFDWGDLLGTVAQVAIPALSSLI
jgi:hypothetical protein